MNQLAKVDYWAFRKWYHDCGFTDLLMKEDGIVTIVGETYRQGVDCYKVAYDAIDFGQVFSLIPKKFVTTHEPVL